jgi:cellulose synthase/poly-beta-1,6-N-acetylglucosamine synthase-like glycosyltransferase
MISLLLRIVTWMLLAPAAALVLYEVLLALVAWRLRRGEDRYEATVNEPLPRLAIVMPAHDEEEGIAASIAAGQALDYPDERYELVVIADNCRDATAAVAREAGARCLERHDLEKRGKGYALRFAFENLQLEEFDAFVVLDADCWLSPHGLRAFAAELQAGHLVLQARYTVANPDATAISYAVAVGSEIENELYYRPKDRLGWVVALRGTGMVFAHEVLEEIPWKAFSIVEDLDYTLRLYRHGHDVHYLHHVEVFSDFPENLEQLRVQRERWAGGNVEMSRGVGLSLLLEGMLRARWTVMDMGLTILSQSRPLLLSLLGGSLILSLVEWLRAATPTSGPAAVALAASLLLCAMMALYLMAGAAALGMNAHRWGLLLRAPAVVAKLVLIALRSALGLGSKGWERTPRESDGRPKQR